MDEDAGLAQKFAVVLPPLKERQRRVLLAVEVGALGPGSVTRVAHAAAVSRATVSKAVAEARHPAAADERVRRRGGGRKRLAERDPGLIVALEAFGGSRHPWRFRVAAAVDVQKYSAIGGRADRRGAPGQPCPRG